MGRESKQQPLGTSSKVKEGKGAKGQLELVFESNGMYICGGIGALMGHTPPLEDKEETIHEWDTRTLDEE
eukprot:4331123-Ditylum_brightwellii.AAC.1